MGEKKEMLKKIESQLLSYNGKDKLTVDEYYNVLKVQFKVDCTKNDIRKVVADLPMDKNNDGEVSKGELKLAKKHLTMKQIQSIMSKLDNNGDGTINWKEMKK